jgi:hypothetical protein
MGGLSNRQRLLIAGVALALALGGCAFYRADQCRDARARLAQAYAAARPATGSSPRVDTSAERIHAAGDIARWCWPLD